MPGRPTPAFMTRLVVSGGGQVVLRAGSGRSSRPTRGHVRSERGQAGVRAVPTTRSDGGDALVTNDGAKQAGWSLLGAERADQVMTREALDLPSDRTG